MKKILNIPEHVIPLGIVYIGYPAEKKDQEQDIMKKEFIGKNISRIVSIYQKITNGWTLLKDEY